MEVETIRVELPDGEWWELRSRPTIRDMLAMQAPMDDLQGGNIDAMGAVIMQLTTGWSLEGEPTAEYVIDGPSDMTIPVLTAFQDEIAPFLEGLTPKPKRNGSSSPSSGRKSRKAMSSTS